MTATDLRGALIGLLLLIGVSYAAAAEPTAEAGWRSVFDGLGARTVKAMQMSPDELGAAVAACDALRPEIEALEGPARKVYLRKLEKIRGLYLFVLESCEPR